MDTLYNCNLVNLHIILHYSNYFSEWEKPREWTDFERQRSAALKSSQDRRSISQKQHPGLTRDRSIRDLDYDDTDSRGSRGRNDVDSDPRMQGRDQNDMDISSSHDTTPTSDESQRHHHHHHHRQQQQQESHHPYDPYDQDKTPPPQQDHTHADGTPSPPGGHHQTVTPTQNESNENTTNNTVGNLIMNSSLVASSPLTALKPQVPALTSSLARFYKESLIGEFTIGISYSLFYKFICGFFFGKSKMALT